MNRNLLWNFSGFLLPSLAALLAVPQLVQLLGVERFGLLSLGWVLIGFLGILDFGLSRAITFAIAGHDVSQGNTHKSLADQLTAIMLVLGTIWMALLLTFNDAMLVSWFSLPETLHQEATTAFMWLAFAIPFMMYANARIAVLEGQQRFIRANTHKIPFGIATFLVPWMIALYEPSIPAIFMGLLLVRVVYAISLSFAIWRDAEYRRASIGQLQRSLAFSGWLAVTNIVGPMLTYFDRFYIGAMLGLAAVSYYTIPYDVLIRFLVLPMAIMAVFFPMLVSAFGTQQVQQQREVLMSANRLLGLLWLPGLVFLMLFMHELLALWLTEDLADHMTHIAQWLAVGVFINGMCMIVYNLIQSTGRSDITAKFHLLELPFYALFFWYAIGQWAVEGAALAWTLRVLFDFILLYSACYVQLPALVTVLKRLLATLVIGVVMFAVAYFVEVTALKILLAGLLMLIPIFGYHMHIINLLKRT